MDKKYLEIYQETQKLAEFLARSDGWATKAEVFHSEHKNRRVSNYFNKACAVMADQHGHEMTDIVMEVEEHLDPKPSSLSVDDSQTAKGRSFLLGLLEQEENMAATINTEHSSYAGSDEETSFKAHQTKIMNLKACIHHLDAYQGLIDSEAPSRQLKEEKSLEAIEAAYRDGFVSGADYEKGQGDLDETAKEEALNYSLNITI